MNHAIQACSDVEKTWAIQKDMGDCQNYGPFLGPLN